MTKGVLDENGPSCHEPEQKTLFVDVEESPKSREFGTTDKACNSAFAGKYIREADAPYGDNEGSTPVETEPVLEDEFPEWLDRAGYEASGDCCHHNLTSIKHLHK